MPATAVIEAHVIARVLQRFLVNPPCRSRSVLQAVPKTTVPGSGPIPPKIGAGFFCSHYTHRHLVRGGTVLEMRICLWAAKNNLLQKSTVAYGQSLVIGTCPHPVPKCNAALEVRLKRRVGELTHSWRKTGREVSGGYGQCIVMGVNRDYSLV